MTLTLGPAPLGTSPAEERNYHIEGPPHRLLATPFPRRVRATLNGDTVLDTRRGVLVHESNLLPALYAPIGDFHRDLLVPTDLSTHCPFKGDAAYHSVRVGDRRAENAVWHYPEPIEAASWLRGYAGAYWDRFDAWFDEDERVHGHLRDPYHRVDVRRSSRAVRVLVGERVVADTHRPLVLSETGLPNRWYLPPADVDLSALASSTTTSHCPYKGDASYWDVLVGETGGGGADGSLDAAAFSYEQPLVGMESIAGMLCFIPTDRITLELDGEAAEG